MTRGEDLNTRLTADDDATAIVDRLADKVEALEDPEHEVDLTADTTDADVAVSNLDRRLDGLTDRERRVLLEVQARQAQRDIERLNNQLARAGELSDDEITLRVNARGDAERRLDAIQSEIRAIDGSTPDITPEVDDRALDRLQQRLDRLELPVQGIEGSFGRLAGVSGRAGLVGALVAGVGLAADRAADTALEANQIANLFGSSVEQASRLLAVLGLAGVEGNDLADIVLNLNDRLAENEDLTRRLGINLNDGLQPLDRFVQVVELLNSEIDDVTDRGIIGGQLFGEEGVRQVNAVTSLVGDLSDAIDNVPTAAVVDDADVERARNYKREIGELSVNLQGLGNSLGFAALQVINLPLDVASDGFTELATQSERLGRAVRDIVAGDPLSDEMRAWVENAADAADEVARFDRSLLDGARDADEVRRIVEDLGLSIEAQNTIVVQWAREFGALRPPIDDAADAMDNLAVRTADFLTQALEAAGAARRISDAVDEELARRRDPRVRSQERLDESDALLGVDAALRRVLDAQRDLNLAQAEGEGVLEARADEQRARNNLERSLLRYLELIGNVPDEIETRLLLAAASADFDELERQLEDITADRDVRIRLNIEEPGDPVEVAVNRDGLDVAVLEPGGAGTTGGQVTAPTIINNYNLGLSSTDLERVQRDAQFAGGVRIPF